MSETVIVVRSVVPGGIAQLDGRLLPGDRIMYVNDVSLDSHTSLDCAVQALKGAPFGGIRIGIARPIITDEEDSKPSFDPAKQKDLDHYYLDRRKNLGCLRQTSRENQKHIDSTNELMAQETSSQLIGQRNTQISVSVSQSFSSTKSVTTASNSARESASDTFDTITGSNLSDWKTDYGVRLKTKTPLRETKQSISIT